MFHTPLAWKHEREIVIMGAITRMFYDDDNDDDVEFFY